VLDARLSTILLVSADGPSLAMPALSYTGPVACHVHHVASIKYTVTEQMVELQTCSIDRPVVTRLRVVEVIAFGCQHRQMLHVAPRQLSTSHARNHMQSFIYTNSTNTNDPKHSLRHLLPPVKVFQSRTVLRLVYDPYHISFHVAQLLDMDTILCYQSPLSQGTNIKILRV